MKEQETQGSDDQNVPAQPLLQANPSVRESSTEMVKDLYEFELRLTNLPGAYLIKIFGLLIKDTMLLVAALVGPLLTTTSGYIYLNYVGKPEVMASFGLYSFLYFAFHMSIMLSSMEKLGIELASRIGHKDYQGCKSVFGKGIMTSMILFTLITLPVALFTEKAFTAMGVEKQNAFLAQQALTASLPMILVMLAKELFQAFCMSQGHESVFGNMGIVTSTFAIVFNYFTIVKWDMDILGWVLSRTIASLLELIFVLYIFFAKTSPESRGFASFQDTIDGFKSYFGDAIKFTLGAYSEYLGFEIAGFFVLLAGQEFQTAAFYSVMNIAGISYTFGYSFAVVARTRLNILIGMGKQQTAKYFFEFFILSTIACGVVWGILVVILREPLALCYASSNDELKMWFKSLLVILAFACPSETSLTSAQIGLKTVGGIGHLLVYSVLTLLVGNVVAGPIFLHFKVSVMVIFGWTMFLTILFNLLVIRKALVTDWAHAKVEEHELPK